MSRKRSKKARKPVFKRKVKLPTDRNGNPVSPGDFMAFDEGVFFIHSLTLYERGEWVANADDWVDNGDIDNISGGEVVYRP